MDQPLTVVLPIYNCERQIRSSLLDVLDLVPTLSRPLEIVVVDDGSIDETYETACELARVYPQITVLRQPVRQGLSAALNLVRNRLNVEDVIVHDGISMISASQLQMMLQSERSAASESSVETDSAMESHGSRRFAAVRALQNSMEQAHRSVSSFRWVRLEKPLIPRRSAGAGAPPVFLGNLPMSGNPTPVN